MGLTELPGGETQEGLESQRSSVFTTEEILTDILMELKEINVHLRNITDESVLEGDLL
jgi:hypothetical protein